MEGHHQAQIAVVKIGLQQGLAPHMLAMLTGLTLEQIQALQQATEG